MGILFSEKQKQVIELANDCHNLFILCGYAGTGKSVISKAILDLLSKRYSKDLLMCCALSGIASDRIRKTSGYQAGTLQNLLIKAQKDGNKLPYKVILLDETSMVNSEILYKLFKISNEETLFILVGDPAQLPPIGAGDPFHDIIKKEITPVIELTKIYRQSEDKVITYFANQIRQAKVPENYRSKYEDFEYIDVSINNYFALKKKLKDKELRKLREENTQKILQFISQKALGYRNNLQHFLKIRDIINFVTYFQLVTPVKNGVLGVDNLNIQLQEILNPKSDSRKLIDLGLVKFHLFDKVVHITNQDMDCYLPQDFKDKNRDEKIKRKRVFNGMIGVLFQIDHKEELL